MVVCAKCGKQLKVEYECASEIMYTTDKNGKKTITIEEFCKSCAAVAPKPGPCMAFVDNKSCPRQRAVIIENSTTNESRWACITCAESTKSRLSGFDVIRM